MKPAKHKFSILKQVCEYIPRNLTPKLSKKYKIHSRSFSPWSHIVSLVHCQLSHSVSLNDISDCLRHHSGVLTTIRGATAPSRNGLSHANRTRDAQMAEDLFWQTLYAFQKQSPGFGCGRNYCGLPRRFKRTIHSVDSTTISLVANCLDWAKHRRRKAAAKCHMRLDVQSFLPSFAIVKSAGTHDSTEAKELCAGVKAGEIIVFDKAYVDYKHLHHLSNRGVFWVSRSKTNMKYDVMGQHTVAKGNILRDQRIKLALDKAQNDYPEELRLVEARVEVDGKLKVLTFISNNFDWAPSSIADLYKSRWAIETFFKEMKQNLQLADFLGHNENAVRWQIWTALLTYVILRFIAYQSTWKASFARLFTAIRGVLWSRIDLYSLLKFCGTAVGKPRMVAVPQQLFLPGFKKIRYG
jgi:hypothetical protein